MRLIDAWILALALSLSLLGCEVKDAPSPLPEETSAPEPMSVEVEPSERIPDPVPKQTPTPLVIAELGPYMTNVVVDACAENGVRIELVLAIIEHECCFVLDAVNPKSGCYGPMQLHPDYFPKDLTPEENIWTGVAYLAELLQRYGGDEAHALTAYNYGPTERTSCWFSDEIFVLAEKWSDALRRNT